MRKNPPKKINSRQNINEIFIEEEQDVVSEINLNMIKEGADPMITESILSKLGAAVGGYIVGKKIMDKIMGKKSDIDKLKDAMVNLRQTIDGIRRK